MDISRRASKLEASATLAVNAKAMELRNSGVNVTSLAVGEPDFPTPLHICEAAKEAIDKGFTRYTQEAGIPELRKAVVDYFNRNYGVAAASDCVCISNGGKQALYNLFQTLLNDGDEVLVPVPYWVSYPPLVEMAGGVPVFVPSSAEKGFKLTPEDFAKYRRPATKAIVINSPSNPTGACYNKQELDAIVEWAVKEGLFVISDEIYDQLVYGEGSAPALPVSAIDWWAKYPEQVAIINGVSKTYAMTGWRVGYLLTGPQRTVYVNRLQGHMTSNVCSISQKAALAALTQPFTLLEEMKAAFVRRRDMAHAVLCSWPGVICPKPGGAFYLFPDVSSLYSPGVPNSTAFCAYMLESAAVALVPGEAFGDDKCVRMSFAVADDTLADAMARMTKAVGQLAEWAGK